MDQNTTTMDKVDDIAVTTTAATKADADLAVKTTGFYKFLSNDVLEMWDADRDACIALCQKMGLRSEAIVCYTDLDMKMGVSRRSEKCPRRG